jgi:hypothetical protein
MAQPSGRLLRDNAFLVAAVLLPVVVVGFFLLSTAIPRWTVPPPAYDLLLRSQKPYDGSRPRIAIEFEVRDGRVQVSARTAAPDAYVPPQVLLLFDHKTMNVSEVPFTAPEPGPVGDPPRTAILDVAAGRRVVAEAKAPDGYALETRTHHGPGLLGDIFGMNHYDIGLSLVNRGRVIPVALPEPYRYDYYSAYFVGWIIDGGR